MKPILTLEDLRSAIHAMASWLDAFGDDPDFSDDAARVSRAIKAFEMIERRMEAEKGILSVTDPRNVN